MSDTASIFSAVRSETAKMLNFDIALLTPAEGVKLDRATALRLELDRILAAQMRGEAIDINRLTAASSQLEEMLREGPAESWDLSRLSDEELDLLARLAAKATSGTLDLELDKTALDRSGQQLLTNNEGAESKIHSVLPSHKGPK